MNPADPDTIMTSLFKAQEFTKATGQDFIVFTSDLQLHKVAQKILWAYPEQFLNVVLRLGGMHMLMSFIGSIGSLMSESGLSEILDAVFAGVPKLLSGKKFPQNVRALRLVMEEILRDILLTHKVDSLSQLMTILESLSSQSRTTKLWVDCLIKPMFIVMKFIRAEREGDWCLHLLAVKEMIPYFFASGHVHYARYGLLYLKTISNIDPTVLEHFMKGEHVMRHIPGYWNAIWSDMFIESTFMRYGHGSKGIVGITLKPETLKVWALGRHLSCHLEQSVDDMINGDTETVASKHKEEGRARMKNDGEDRNGLKQMIENVIHPLNPQSHTNCPLNIVSGKVSPETVNVDKCLEIGKGQMTEFEEGLPDGFYAPIRRKVVTMTASKKSVQIGDQRVFDTNVIYSRLIGLQASSREIDILKFLDHELAPVPTSMFSETGEMRIAKSKSTLMTNLKAETSERLIESHDAVFINASAVLWTIHWPENGKVIDYITNVKNYLSKILQLHDVYMIFDRYYEYSPKDSTRTGRYANSTSRHQLTFETVLPPQKTLLGNIRNKVQLIELVVQSLANDSQFAEVSTRTHKLVVTGQHETPVEISHGGVVMNRGDLRSTHEEADVLIIQQLIAVQHSLKNSAVVISADTDVFVLLLSFAKKYEFKFKLFMESPIKNRFLIDIDKTVENHDDIVADLLPAHAISGCDTVACYFGIGKGAVVKVLKTGFHFNFLGNSKSRMEDVFTEASNFILSCYGIKNASSMSEARIKSWASKAGKGLTSSPKLESLPPTKEAFFENVKRGHLQACVWSTADESQPPDMPPEKFGFTKDLQCRTLTPILLPDGVPVAPDFVLNLVKCNCQALTSACATKRCRCKASGMNCTLFCGCRDKDCTNLDI